MTHKVQLGCHQPGSIRRKLFFSLVQFDGNFKRDIIAVFNFNKSTQNIKTKGGGGGGARDIKPGEQIWHEFITCGDG